MLWYVRLRRASKKKIYHTDLLRVERLAGPISAVANPIMMVRSATLTEKEREEITNIKENIKEEQKVSEESLVTEASEDSEEDFE